MGGGQLEAGHEGTDTMREGSFFSIHGKKRRRELARRKNKAGRRPGFAYVYADQIWYFSTLSGREAASMERLITKLIFSFSEKASSQPRKATSASGDLSFTSL